MRSEDIKLSQDITQKLDTIIRRLNVVVVILLAQSGLDRKQVAKTLGVSEKTIERMIPFRELKKRG